MNPERCQTSTVIIYADGLCWVWKKIIYKQWRCFNSLSKFMRIPLETTKLHRRWFDLWKLNMATVSKPSQIFTTALWSQIMAPCQIWTISDLFYILKKFDNKKSIFLCFHTIILHIALLIFLAYGIHIWRRSYERFS